MSSLKGSVLAGFACLFIIAVHGQQLSPEDRQFIEKAAQAGMHEVHMGQIGIERGSSQAIKQYSQRLVDDHTKANQELAELAKRKGVTLPPAATQSDSRHSSRTGTGAPWGTAVFPG